MHLLEFNLAVFRKSINKHLNVKCYNEMCIIAAVKDSQSVASRVIKRTSTASVMILLKILQTVTKKQKKKTCTVVLISVIGFILFQFVR